MSDQYSEAWGSFWHLLHIHRMSYTKHSCSIKHSVCYMHTKAMLVHYKTFWVSHCKNHSSSSGWIGVHHLNPYRIDCTSCKSIPLIAEACLCGAVVAWGIIQRKCDILFFKRSLMLTSQVEVTECSVSLCNVHISMPLEENSASLRISSKILHSGFIWGRNSYHLYTCLIDIFYLSYTQLY